MALGLKIDPHGKVKRSNPLLTTDSRESILKSLVLLVVKSTQPQNL
jgi:hypothetical protein